MVDRFSEMLADAANPERNRLRDVESPLPGKDVQDIGMLIISPALDDRLSQQAAKRGMNVGELIAKALDLFEKENS